MKYLYTLVLCLFFFSLQAQDYYYNGNEKIEVYKSEKSFVSFEIPNQIVIRGFEKVSVFSEKAFTILKNKKTSFSINEFKKQNLNQVVPALLLDRNDEFEMFPTKTIRVKLKPNNTKNDVTQLFENNDIIKIEEKYEILRIRIMDISKSLEIANKIYESGIAEFSIPDFYTPIQVNQINDPLFPLQFQMNNTGQVIDGVAGTNDIDSNALEAWNINLGDNITVAVFDQGLENHEDFGNRLIGGFTPATNGNGTPLVNNATHGMNCAGVIGASDNNLGLRGVAPNVNFLSVNIFANGTTFGDIADGIQWAINNGADVLSNSWSYQNVPCNFTNIDIENAIQNAVTNGRNGNGAVVVFSSGNTGACVNYPARNNNVVSVGAINNNGNLFNYSSRGPELDLVAPSGETNYLGNIRTTDRMGNAGRVAGNYEPSFGGTSASCPVVSGVAALVLSVNPNLTQQEVRDILTSTATDMGVGGFDNNFGFGRVNAFSAVQASQLSLASISGSDIVCNSNTTFILQNGGTPVTWQVSNNIQIISSNNTSITVRTINSNASGQGFIRAILPFGTIQENVDVGSAPIDYVSFSNGADSGYYFCTSHYGNAYQIYPQNLPNTTYQYRLLRYPNLNVVYTSPTGRSDSGQVNYIPPQGWYVFEVRATNSCGTGQWVGYEVEYIDCSIGGGGGDGGDGGEYFISPNPTSDSFTISRKENQDLISLDTEEITYELYDLNYALKLKGDLKKSRDITISSLKRGIYILRIISKTDIENHRIIIK